MKKLNKITLIAILSMITVFVHAQTKTSLPGWYISKDVQRISNKANLQRLAASELKIKTLGYPEWVISKDVMKPRMDQSLIRQGNVISGGHPLWIISKGVNHLNKK